MFSRRHAATLLAAAVAALAAPAGAQASAQDAPCPGADLTPVAGNLTQVSQATLCLLNNERVTHGLRPLTEAAALTQPSAAYSARMVTENFFAHVAPDGSTLTDRLEADGYIDPDGDWTVGENIAWGQGDISTARAIAVAWMNSPPHRENILEPEYTEVGIGIVPGTPGDASWGATYTTDFGAVVRDTTTGAVARAASAKPRKASAKRCKTTTVRVRAAGAKGRAAKTKRVATCSTARRTTARTGR
jgi:uncharacterized protein YkwD